MATPSIRTTIGKLALAGEQAGFTVEQMIRILNAGVTVEDLLGLIEWRLRTGVPERQMRSTRWVV